MSKSSMTVKPQAVLDKLMDDGTFDSLRASLVALLKSNDALKSFILTSVAQSHALKSPAAESKKKNKLFEELRQELSSQVLEMASKAAWELMVSKEEMGKEITEKVDATYCQLTARPFLSCDCHPGIDTHEYDSSANSNTEMVATSKTCVGMKRQREEDLVRPVVVSRLIADIPSEKTMTRLEKGEEDVRQASCKESTSGVSQKVHHTSGYWISWMGPPEGVDLMKNLFI